MFCNYSQDVTRIGLTLVKSDVGWPYKIAFSVLWNWFNSFNSMPYFFAFGCIFNIPFLAQDNTIMSDVSSGGSLEKTVNRSIEFYFGQHLSANEIWCAHNVFVVNLERNFLFKYFRNKKFYFKNHLTFQKLLIFDIQKRATFSLFIQFWVLFGTNFFELSEIKEI